MFTIRKALAAIMMVSAAAATQAETPADTMKAFYKVADARPFDQKALAAFFADHFTDHDSQPGSASHSAAEVVGLFGMLLDASEDGVHNITFIEPVGKDKALVRWKYQGTHTGNMFGMPASGRKFDIAGMELWEFDKNGKINGLWHVEEIQKMIGQLMPAE